MTGYLHPDYARSLEEFGLPVALPKSGGWLLARSIPQTDFQDAMGCYPLFCCSAWSALKSDLDDLADKCIAVSLVTDPFAPIQPNELKQGFELVRALKDHFVVELELSANKHVSSHHRYYARKSLRHLEVEVVSDPRALLEPWMNLYDTLIQRHHLTGIKAFSRKAFALQLQIPGLVMFTATTDGELVGAQLWYVQEPVAYSHLTALSEKGYSMRAAYGIYWTAIHFFKERFAKRLRWLDLGAGAGVSTTEVSGLAEFKKGWASRTRTKYFCGRIYQPEIYDLLANRKKSFDRDYFPSYRAGELA